MALTASADPGIRFQLGELVEVLQRSKGLRGSWQLATISLVKIGRREVEYFHLYRGDGDRLRESFSVMEDSEDCRAEWCKKYGSKVRGFLRPLCPQITSRELKTWTKGCFVDVLMENGAWWEGVLLEKIENADGIEYVNVLFPDTNANALVSVKKLRLSHDWDEITGRWDVRGMWKGCPKLKHGRLTSWQESHNSSSSGWKRASSSSATTVHGRAERKKEYAHLCQKRNEAKQVLLDAGYTIEFHQRIGRARETVYVSPFGNRYYSLTRACNAWRRQSGLLPTNAEEPVKNEVQLIQAYDHREDTKCASLDETGDSDDEDYCPRKSYKKKKRCPKLFFSPVLDDYRHGRGSISPDSSALGSSAESRYCSLTRVCRANDEDFFPKKHTREKKRQSSISLTAALDVDNDKYRKGSLSPNSVGHVSPAGNMCYSSSRSRKGRKINFCLRNTKTPENKEMKLLDTYNLRQEAQSSIAGKTGGVDDEDLCLKELTRKEKELPKLCSSSKNSKGSLSPDSVLTEVTDSRIVPSAAVACLESNGRIEESMDSDDICSACGEGGELIICDHCPSSYHLNCAGLQTIPEGNWYCFSCSCKSCKSYLFGPENDTLPYTCSQCNNKYHADCIHSKQLPEMHSVREKSWFCCGDCETIHAELNQLLGNSHPLGVDGLSWILLRHTEQQGCSPYLHSDLMMNDRRLSSAYVVLQECFLPMIDAYTGIDIISQVLLSQGSSITRLNCRGFYTLILEKGNEPISVATIRIHGSIVAEMPFIGTRFLYRRKGMCRHLLSVLEKMLDELGVEKLILPATPDLRNTWKRKFCFKNIDHIDESEMMGVNLMRFPGTSLLKKYIPKLGNCNLIEDDWKRARKFKSILSIELASVAMLSKDGNRELVSIKQSNPRRRNSCVSSRATVDKRKIRKRLFDAEAAEIDYADDPFSSFNDFWSKSSLKHVETKSVYDVRGVVPQSNSNVYRRKRRKMSCIVSSCE